LQSTAHCNLAAKIESAEIEDAKIGGGMVNGKPMNRKKTLAAKLSETKPAPRKPALKKEDKRTSILRCIRALPPGTVSTYGAIAKAAGWPGGARQVVRILHQAEGLSWHRVVGAGGAIKLRGENAAEQTFRLRLEGVTFRGARVDMKRHEHHFPGRRIALR
jgi:methylated-DNA-protein-cysteine methyltransferase related protein